MERNDVLILVAETFSQDAILQTVSTETAREVFATAKSVSFNEWNETGKRGLRPAWKMEVFPLDYAGELIAEYRGVRYRVYRTYQASEETLELYLEERSGDGNSN